jgi:NADH-quinone oxidoreductase subunit J
MSVETIFFWVFAVLSVACATLVIFAKNPISSAMALVGTFFFLAGIYALLWAHTIAVIQVLVYAGAIMVLFLFVIMLLSLTDAPIQSTRKGLWRALGGVSAAALLAFLIQAILQMRIVEKPFPSAQLGSFGTLRVLGQVMYGTYLLPFEVVSLLLLVSIVGSVVVAKSRI